MPRSFLPFWMDAARPPEAERRRSGSVLSLFLAICLVAAIYSSIYAPSESGPWGWYSRLLKPSWVPRAGITGAISTMFYLVMAISIWRIWRTGAFRTVPATIVGFGSVLFLQTLWSTLFYGLQNPALGMLDMFAICIHTAVLWLIYRPLDAIAARLWLAYLVWVHFLLAVSASIWWLNR